MRLSHQIVLASMNVDKFREFQALLSAYPGIELIPAEGLVRNPEKLDLVEKYPTYLENAVAKARLVNAGCHYPALADDTGLEVEALGGKPGVRTRRYATAKPGQSQDEANVQQLLAELKGREERSAKFLATLTLAIEGILVHATGMLEGSIADVARGTNGFGYDPVFIPKGSTKTLAEMTDTEKNAISHRAKALHELMAQVRARGIVFAKP